MADRLETSLPDAAPRNWVDTLAPAPARPFLRLARLDRPIGWWLLLLPAWWSVLLGTAAAGARWPDPGLLLLFLVGAIAMRGAGCTYNDILDRDIDARVARTRSRPIASGQVSLRAASLFLLGQCLVGLCVLLALTPLAQLIALASLGLVAAYPFMKRITSWPQAWLGLTFGWGALVGYPAVTGTIGPEMALLYGAAILWTIGYDTIYAHQDKEDDALIGIGSSALALGARTRPALVLFYGGAGALLLAAGIVAGLAWPFYTVLALALAQLASQIHRLDIDDPALCLRLFKSNREAGLLVGLAFLAGLPPVPVA
ncbi:MAG: 4-hydroxybenzoate octaprenyltransferase [Alphaproteobacteria bacterium]|nr:4-hydroxybenzoate octaprenyltransferase [Alphaproteobacteria bacterium]